MLITLNLITSNVYNGVTAPSDRDISFIEIWMVIVYIPISVALIEYGVILALDKYRSLISKNIGTMYPNTDGELDMHKISKKIDFWTFLCSLIIFTACNCVYWAYVFC